MCDEQVLREVFAAFDTDKSGSIDTKELSAVIKAYFESVGQAVDDKRIKDTVAVSCCASSSAVAEKPRCRVGKFWVGGG